MDRLREIASAVRGSVWANTDVQFCREHGLTVDNAGGRMGDELRSIADQIEAEQEERVTRRLEDREAAEWVRERGGLEKIKRQRMESVPREAYERKRRALLDHIAECETALRKRKQRIEDLGRCIQSRNDERAMLHDEFEHMRLNHIEGLAFEKLVDDIAARLGVSVMGFDSQDTRDRIMPVLERRLMPEGIKWPRFEDGELVRMCDEATKNGDDFGISTVTLYNGGDFAINFRTYQNGERVKRPAPKVLDADGAEIRLGDEVFVIETGKVHHVSAIDQVGKRFKSMEQMSGDASWLDPACFTHRAPVLAADGKPLREGETVYLTDSPTAFVVDDIMTREDGATVVHLKDGAWNLPQYLTHERPDSWERIEEDARKLAPDYWGCFNFDCDDCPAEVDGERPSERFDTGSCGYAQQIDIVRRAKALAERDA